MPTALASRGEGWGGLHGWPRRQGHRTRNKQPASPLRSVVSKGPVGAPPPAAPGVQKARSSQEKRGRGNGKGGQGNGGPGPRPGAITSRRSAVPATHHTRDRWRNLRVLMEPVPATHQPQGTYRKTASPECNGLARSPPGRPPPTRGRTPRRTQDGMHPHSTNS